MKFNRKNNETMLWIDSLKKIVRFTDGVADVDEKTGNEMKKLGYIERPKEKAEAKTEATTKKKAEVIKPLKPLVENVETDDPINCEV